MTRAALKAALSCSLTSDFWQLWHVPTARAMMQRMPTKMYTDPAMVVKKETEVDKGVGEGD